MGAAKRRAEAFERAVKQIDANIKAVDEATAAQRAGRETPDNVIDLIGRSHRLIADCAGRGQDAGRLAELESRLRRAEGEFWHSRDALQTARRRRT
jgi:hypothetical protein